MTAQAPLLSVEDLRVEFPTRTGLVRAVRGVSFDVGREKVGIVGESGSGKSQTGRAILRLTPRPGVVTAKRMTFEGIDLLTASERAMYDIRGKRIAMVLQDPKFSLNPVMSVGKQIAEAYRAHAPLSRGAARQHALDMLSAVKMRDPRRVYDSYPHELSGGMGQRAMIAMMLGTEPDLLIADEPTSALDVTVQMQVLAILDDLVSQRGMGLIFISHNLTVVSSFCDRVLIMYGGKIMEECAARDLHKATHPYTRALLAAAPSLDDPKAELATMTRDPAWLA